MPPTDDSFTVFMGRLGAGDDESARQLFCRFASRLIGLARIHLDRRIRQKVDPEDVLQSVYRSFFRRQAEGEFDPARLGSPVVVAGRHHRQQMQTLEPPFPHQKPGRRP